MSNGRPAHDQASAATSDYGPVPESRLEEYQQLMQLLLENCTIEDAPTIARAEWIARSALEPGHLWRAMGVVSRDEVRLILRESFPALEAANDKDMRWKKYFYKRICGWTGFET